MKKIKRISYYEEIRDPMNDNLDVFVELSNNSTYCITIATPLDLAEAMRQENKSYMAPGIPYIIVEKITDDIIRQVTEAYVEENDSYWLKYHHYAGFFNLKKLNQFETEYLKNQSIFDSIKDLKEDIETLNLDKSEIVNRLDIISSKLLEN